MTRHECPTLAKRLENSLENHPKALKRKTKRKTGEKLNEEVRELSKSVIVGSTAESSVAAPAMPMLGEVVPSLWRHRKQVAPQEYWAPAWCAIRGQMQPLSSEVMPLRQVLQL